MEHINVEPIEEYLRSVVCIDRLAMYIDAITLFKELQRGTIIDSMNTLLYVNDESSPNEVVDEIHQSMIRHMRSIAGDFGLVTEHASLSFLIKLVRALNLLDVWDEHEHIFNLASTVPGEPHQKLFPLLNIIETLDEEEYYHCVTMAPQSLIDRIIDIHSTRLEELQLDSDIEEIPTVVAKDPTLLRKVVRSNRQLIISQMFSEGVVSDFIDGVQLAELASPYFNDVDGFTPKQLAAELIGVFLLTGLLGDELITFIRENMYLLLNDDELLSKINVVLGNVYTELTT